MKSQRVTFLVLIVVCALLAIEFFRREGGDKVSEAVKEEVESISSDSSSTVAMDSIPQVSVADSIAATYAPMAFRDDQYKHPRVKAAYVEKGKFVQNLYREKKIDSSSLKLYLRAFKKEKTLEVWASDANKEKYVLLKTYPFCQSSGTLGPKRKEGDGQIPEGFYRINAFNPDSQYHLSLKVNYPNKSDLVLSDSLQPGSDIFIHGDCVTIGCIPITDDKIEELYLMAIDAKAAGNPRIPVSIFPAHLSETGFASLRQEYADRPDLIRFWKDLEVGYAAFEECQKLPQITFTAKGRYICSSVCN